MPVPPSAIIQKNSKFYYIYHIFQDIKKPWNDIVNDIDFSNGDKVIFENNNLVYNENYLWEKFKKQNLFDKLISGSPDPTLTYLVAGTIIGNILVDGKVWLMIIGKASSGKTLTVNLFQSLEKQKLAYFVGKFTSAAFFSVRNYNESILTQVQKGGTIVCKDFSSFLARGMSNYYKIMNMLREVYDGFYEDKTVQGTYRWVGKIGLIVCSTPIVQRKRAYMYEMGDRFIYYRINPTFQPVLCNVDLGQYILDNCYENLLNEKGELKKIDDFNNPYKKDIELIAEIIEIGRTANPFKYRGMRDYVIEPNQHYRLMKQLETLAVGMSIACGFDSVNEKIMKTLMELIYRGCIERYANIINLIFKEKISDLRIIKRNYNLSSAVFELAIEDLINFKLLSAKNDKIMPANKFMYIYEKY